MHHGEKDIFPRVIDKPPDELLARFSGEFIESDLEKSFIDDLWVHYKKSAEIVLLVGGLIFLAFIGVDLLTTKGTLQMQVLFLRGLGGITLVGSSLYIHRAKNYFAGFHLLLFVSQAIIVFALMVIGFIRLLPFIHNLFHLFIVTLAFYVCVQNRFIYTVFLTAFVQLAYLATSFGMYQLQLADITRFVLYIGGANCLGIFMLKNLNRSRRMEYIRLIKEQQLNRELRQTLDHLHTAQQEVKTLQGLIPICSHCKRIRDDKGGWNQLEAYIRDHSKAEFTHGICPKCLKELYPNFEKRSE
jgi:hypothetical protein